MQLLVLRVQRDNRSCMLNYGFVLRPASPQIATTDAALKLFQPPVLLIIEARNWGMYSGALLWRAVSSAVLLVLVLGAHSARGDRSMSL